MSEDNVFLGKTIYFQAEVWYRHGGSILLHAYRLPDSDDQGPNFSAADFAKFCSTVCEIPQHYYPQMPYILRPVGIIVLTDNTSKYKEV